MTPLPAAGRGAAPVNVTDTVWPAPTGPVARVSSSRSGFGSGTYAAVVIGAALAAVGARLMASPPLRVAALNSSPVRRAPISTG